METVLEIRGDIAVLAITGSVDGTTAELLAAAFDTELATGRTRLVAALSGVDYTSSAGLRVLLSTVRSVREAGGDLRLAGASRHVLKVLDMSGFTGIFKIFPDTDAAVASFTT